MRGLTEAIELDRVWEQFEALSAELQKWCKENNLPQWSADELVMEENISDNQRKWLRDFISRWEAVESDEQQFFSA